MSNTEAAILRKAFGDPEPLNVLRQLSVGEKCACVLLESMNITRPTLSHHMKVLCGCELVRERRDRKWSRCLLDDRTCAELSRFIEDPRPLPCDAVACGCR